MCNEGFCHRVLIDILDWHSIDILINCQSTFSSVLSQHDQHLRWQSVEIQLSFGHAIKCRSILNQVLTSANGLPSKMLIKTSMECQSRALINNRLHMSALNGLKNCSIANMHIHRCMFQNFWTGLLSAIHFSRLLCICTSTQGDVLHLTTIQRSGGG